MKVLQLSNLQNLFLTTYCIVLKCTMVKQVTAILLTIAIVSEISAAQDSNQESYYSNNYHYHQPENYLTLDTPNNFDDQDDHSQYNAPFTPTDRYVRQNNDVFNSNKFNRFNFGVGSNVQNQPVDNSGNFNWDVNSDTNQGFSGHSGAQGLGAVNGNNNFAGTVGHDFPTGSNSRSFSPTVDFSNNNAYWNLNSGINKGLTGVQGSTDVNNNYGYANTEAQDQVKGFDSNSIDFSKGLNWNVNKGIDRGFTGIPEAQGSENFISQNNFSNSGAVQGGITNSGSKNIPNHHSDTTTHSGYKSDFKLNGNSGNSVHASDSIPKPLTTLKSSVLSGAHGKFDNIYQTADGKLVKVVELVDNLRQDIGSFIPRKSQVLQKLQENLLQKSKGLNIGASGTVNVPLGSFDGKANSANINIGISKNIDVSKAIDGKLNLMSGAAGKVTDAAGGLLNKAGSLANAKSNAIHGSISKAESIKGGLLNKAGALASAKTNVIRGTLQSATEKFANISGGLLEKAEAISNAKTNAIRGTVNKLTGKVDQIHGALIEKAGIIIDAKTGAILGILNKGGTNHGDVKGGSGTGGTVSGAKSGSLNIESTKGKLSQSAGDSAAKSGYSNTGSNKGGLLQSAGAILGGKTSGLSGSISANKNINIGGQVGSGSIGVAKRGAITGAFNPLSAIGRKIANISGVDGVIGTVSSMKSGAANLTDRVIHPGKYYGIGAIKRRVVNNILDDVQDELQGKIGNVVGTLSGIGEGVKSHISDLSIIDRGDKNVLKIVNGLYDTHFYLNDHPIEQAFVIFSDENLPVDFFAESLDNQQRIIEECIPTGQVYIAYKPDCVNVEEDEKCSLDFVTARKDVKNQLDTIVDHLFEKYGNQIIRKAVSVTNKRL